MKENSIIQTAKAVEDFYSSDKSNLRFWSAKLEKYSVGRVANACLAAGTRPDVAEAIANEIDRYVDNRVKMSDVRPLIFALLQRYDAAAARRFKGGEIFVRTSAQRFEHFNAEKIAQSLVKETEIDPELAGRIADEVESFIRRASPDYVSSQLVREITSVKLLEYGQEEARKKYARLGTPVWDIEQMIQKSKSTDIKRENANQMHAPETINWVISGEALEQYALTRVLPDKLADSHLSGDYHIHILSMMATRPNCIQHFPPLFFKHGLRIDGTGKHTSVAKPAKHLVVAIQHCAKMMLAGQTQMAGGQSIDGFNVWLAPFLKGRSDQEMEQAAQEFIYELNQSYVARGGQVVFSNLGFDIGVPEWLKNVPAIGPGGEVMGVYGDYEEEVLAFLRAYIKMKMKGDATGKPHMWPNDVFKVRPNTFSNGFADETSLIHQYIAKFGTPYIANAVPDWQTEQVNYMGCRTRLDSRFAGPWGTIRTGNELFVTLNLPRIAYMSGGDDAKFFELMNARMEEMSQVLKLKHGIDDNLLHEQHLLQFLTQKFGEEEYYNLKNSTKTFGYVGLTEATKVHCGAHLHDDANAHAFGVKVISAMRDFTNRMTKETGLRFSVIATPAETTAARFIKLDMSKFGHDKVIYSGTKVAPYYTNSHMVKMDAQMPLFDRIRTEEPFHPLTNGGHIFHIWLGENYPDSAALVEVTKKICNNTNIGFFAYTRDFSVCNGCGKFDYGLLQNCGNCTSADLNRYSRITGYYQRVESWNAAKRQELKDRFRLNPAMLLGE